MSLTAVDQRTLMADQTPETATARIDRDLLEQARIIVAFNRRTGKRPAKLTDYLHELLRPLISAEYKKVVAQMSKEEAPEKKPPTKPKKKPGTP